jgi:hypothetical protein
MKEFLKTIWYHIILFLWIILEFFDICFTYLKKRLKKTAPKINKTLD